MKSFAPFIILLLLLLLSIDSYSTGINQIERKQVWTMKQATESSLQEGLSGSFFGKQDDWFILAGGSNFPNGKPWEGGTKTFSDKIFIFSENSNNQFQLINTSKKLPFALAEGAYVSTPKGLLCIGGETPNGLSKQVFLINYDGQEISILMLPELPLAVRNATATIVNSDVYLLGGQKEDGKSVKQFLKLDLNNLNKQWQSLTDFPVPVSAASMSAQQDGEEISLFAFGGRSLSSSNITTFYSTVYNYKLSKGKWTAKKNIVSHAFRILDS